MNRDRLEGIKWLSFGLLFLGIILKWLHIDEQGILLNIGLISFGLAALIDFIKAKYYKQFNLDTLRLALPLIVIISAADNLLTGSSNYTIFVVVILFQYVLGQGKSLLIKKQRPGV